MMVNYCWTNWLLPWLSSDGND